MAEIILTWLIGKKIGQMARTKGYPRIRRTQLVIMFVAMWFAGEISGAILGIILIGSPGDNFGAVYAAALAGALVGWLSGFVVVAFLPEWRPMYWHDVTEEYHRRTFEHEGRLSSLPAEWQRELAALWRLEADVNTGGYLLFLQNWGTESYVYASQALKNIGARRTADLIDRCQTLVDEHFDSERKPFAEPQQLLPNAIIKSDGTINEAGSILPDPIVARITRLSYQFMKYPDNLAKLGLTHYGPHLREVEQLIIDREKAARMKRERTLAILETDLREAERAHEEELRQGKVCPKCGFAYSWNGVKCGHCRYQIG